MGKLVYSTICSLDGFSEDADGDFSWAAPDHEVHSAINELERGISTYIYGRRMYETMAVWETMDIEGEPKPISEYKEIWRAAAKIVVSSSLTGPWTERTRVVATLDEALGAIGGDAGIGGPTLAAEAFKRGAVDEVHLFLNPVIVGGGVPALPRDAKSDLTLLDERRFDGGVVHLHYATA